MTTNQRVAPAILAPLMMVTALWALPEAHAADPGALTLTSYLQQVETQNDGVRASQRAAGAANMYVKEARIGLMPTAFASYTRKKDQSPQPPVLLQYDSLLTERLEVGVSQNTEFGLNGRIFYDLNSTQYSNLKFGAQTIGVPLYYDAHPTVELTLSLWRNWRGGETMGQVETSEAQARLDKTSADYQTEQLRLTAEAAYWRLVLAREAVGVAREASARTDQIDAWTRRRTNLQLADRSDFLQSQAAVKSRRLDLRTRLDEERAASIAFNSARSEPSLSVAEKLLPFSGEAFTKLPLPERRKERGDVAVARENARLTAASARLAAQRDLPTVELFGAYALSSLNGTAADTTGTALAVDHPTQTIGVRLTAPLAFGALSDARKGREMQESAADLTLRRKSFEQDRDWDDLAQKFTQAKERLDLAQDLESAQKEKLNYERARQRNGRTTMQQVLLFEIDYENAQLGRITILSELNGLLAQMKLFGVTLALNDQRGNR